MSLNTQPSSLSPDDLPHNVKRRRRKHRTWYKRLFQLAFLRRQSLRLLIALALVIIVGVVGILVLATDSNNRINASLDGLQRVLASIAARSGTELTLNDFNRLQASLNETQQTLSNAQSQIGFMRPVIALNAEWDTQWQSLSASLELIDAAKLMLDGVQPTLSFLAGNQEDNSVIAEISSAERVVELLVIGRNSFLNAQESLVSAQNLLTSLPIDTLNTSSLLALEELQNFVDQLNEINRILLASPDLLTLAFGLETQRNYLILAQNNDELRPSGGYISTYGWLTIRSGRITDYDYQATTATTPNPPRDDLASQISVPNWWIQYGNPVYAAWDGSWYADFPSTAQLAMWFYNNGNNPQAPVDGVIAIDISAFEALLGALGQVTVPEYNRVVTHDNFRNVVYDIRASGEGTTPHKRFIAALYKQIFTDWQNTTRDPAKSAEILGMLLQGLQEKHIMLYFNESQLNEAIGLLSWGGNQSIEANADYLMVVDANLGNKSNYSIRRQTTYDVSLHSDGSAENRLTISYDYSAARASSDPAVNAEFHGLLDYNNLLQVFTPPNTLLDNQSGFSNTLTTALNGTSTQFSAIVQVPFDSVQRFQLSYRIPDIVNRVGNLSRYRLFIQKQAGMRAETVSLLISLPPDAELVSITPEPIASYRLEQEIVELRFELLRDEMIEVLYR